MSKPTAFTGLFDGPACSEAACISAGIFAGSPRLSAGSGCFTSFPRGSCRCTLASKGSGGCTLPSEGFGCCTSASRGSGCALASETGSNCTVSSDTGSNCTVSVVGSAALFNGNLFLFKTYPQTGQTPSAFNCVPHFAQKAISIHPFPHFQTAPQISQYISQRAAAINIHINSF